jgi:hypothetical protein
MGCASSNTAEPPAAPAAANGHTPIRTGVGASGAVTAHRFVADEQWWVLSVFSAATGAYIFKEDMYNKLQEDMDSGETSAVIRGRVEIVRHEFLDMPSDLQAWVMQVGCRASE